MDEAGSRHCALVAAVRQAVFESAGVTDPSLRRAAGSGDPLPEPWGPYAEAVRHRSSRITDSDVAALKSAGRTEEEIFEVTVAAAMGAALHGLDAGLAALRGSVT